MEFTVNKTPFSEALSLVASIVPDRAARAVMQNLMITGNDDNTITVSATDLEIGIKIRLEVSNLQEPDKVLLPASRLNALVKGTFAETIDITIHDYKAVLKTKQGKFNIPGSDIVDYPSIPEFKSDGAAFVHGDDFADAIHKTAFATSKGDARFWMSGIYLRINENDAEFVSSDTFRLALVKKKVRNPDNAAFDGIITAKGMSTLARLAANSDVVELNMTDNELMARTANAEIIIRKLEGVFPRYQDVIPQKTDMSVTVKKDELLRSLQTIGIMTSEESRSVLFHITDGAIDMSAKSDSGDGNLVIDAEKTGSDVDISFNSVYVIDALKIIPDETVTIHYSSADNPARIDSGDFLYVIMPVNR